PRPRSPGRRLPCRRRAAHPPRTPCTAARRSSGRPCGSPPSHRRPPVRTPAPPPRQAKSSCLPQESAGHGAGAVHLLNRFHHPPQPDQLLVGQLRLSSPVAHHKPDRLICGRVLLHFQLHLLHPPSGHLTRRHHIGQRAAPS